MRRVLPAVVLMFTFVLCVSLIAAAEQGKDKTKKSPIEGSWSAKKGEGTMVLTFAGDKFTLTKSRDGKSEDITGTYKLDAKATPNTIDMTPTGGTAKEIDKYKGKTSHGIVKVDGDKLEWCANEPGKDGRPKIFADKDGDNFYLYVTFTREKK